MFLSPAPVRPDSKVYHSHDWQGWWHFGTGSLGDMVFHSASFPFMDLKLGLPTRVSAESVEINLETCPTWSTITYEFPSRDSVPPVKPTWYEGARDCKRHLPPPKLFQGKIPSDSGSRLVGEKGSIFSPSNYGTEQVVLDASATEEKPAKSKLKTNPDADHKAEWVRAIRAGDPTISRSNFAYSGVLTEAMLLGNVAVRLGKPIDDDPATGKVTNVSEAARFVHPEFRKGWEI